MASYLVVGSTGLLGEAFFRILRRGGHEVRELNRSAVDLRDHREVRRQLRQRSFDVLINCAGMTSLERCLDKPREAFILNADIPGLMALLCREKGAKLVHFSTDYVFSGKDDHLKTETDETFPINIYGKSKLEGERLLSNIGADTLICRVSWIFGQGRPTFVDQVIRNANGNETAYVSDKWSIPTFADDIVVSCLQCLDSNKTGILHFASAGGAVTWHEYACEILKVSEKLGIISGVARIPQAIPIAGIDAMRELRPIHTAMRSTRIPPLPDWREGIRDFLREQCDPS